MTLNELVERLKAEYVGSGIQCIVAGRHITIATLGTDGFALTQEGIDLESLLSKMDALVQAEVPTKNLGGRPRKVVED